MEPAQCYNEDKMAFGERLKQCVRIIGSENALARKASISTAGLRKYLSGGEPTRPVLIAIATAAGVNVEWLATGKGPMRPSDLPKPPTASEYQDRLRLAIEAVEEGLAATNKTLQPAQKAELILTAYELLHELDGASTAGKDNVIRLLRLVA